jgi:hypothetical protein
MRMNPGPGCAVMAACLATVAITVDVAFRDQP